MARFFPPILCLFNGINKSREDPFPLNVNAHTCAGGAVLFCQAGMLSLSQADEKTMEVSGPSESCTNQDF